MNMMRGLLLLPTLCLLLVLAHHTEARLVPNMFHDAAARKPVPCTWVCGTGSHIYECHCVPNDSPSAADVKIVASQLPTLEKFVVAQQSNEASNSIQAPHAAAHKPVPCTWVCGTGCHIYECHCVPIPPQQQDDRFSLQSEPVTTDATAAALAVSDSAGRVFGIPGTLLGDTILQTGPGTSAGVITTLFQGTSVQVMCRKSDVPVNGDPWWVKVHVLTTGQEGWVPDFWVQCSGIGNCEVPLCV